MITWMRRSGEAFINPALMALSPPLSRSVLSITIAPKTIKIIVAATMIPLTVAATIWTRGVRQTAIARTTTVR